MLLNDEHERPAPPLDWHGSRLRCSFEFALGGIFAELVFGHGEILGERPCGCWLVRAATPTRSGKEIFIQRTSNQVPCWPGMPNGCRPSRSTTPSTECPRRACSKTGRGRPRKGSDFRHSTRAG